MKPFNRSNAQIHLIYEGKISLSVPRRHIGEVEVYLHLFLTSAPDEGEWLSSCPVHFVHGKKTGNHSVWGWVSPRTLMDVVEKGRYSFSAWLHGVIALKTTVWIFTVMKTSNFMHVKTGASNVFWGKGSQLLLLAGLQTTHVNITGNGACYLLNYCMIL